MDGYQEAEWEKAQAIGISCDLVAAAKYHLEFLALVGQYPCLYRGPAVQRAIYRYEHCWLPLLANSEAKEDLLPPLDCEWVWHCHRLNPLQYASYCHEFYGRLLPATTRLPCEKDSAMNAAAKLWEKAFPDEPISLDLDAFSCTKDNRSSIHQHYLTEAITKQRSFFQQVSSPYMSDERFLRVAEQRYRAFLHLIKKSKSSHVPTHDIELIWRSHQLNPQIYANDTVELLGEVLQHYNITSTATTGARFPETTKQWENTFGRRYMRAGPMQLHTTQQSPSAQESMEIRLEIVRARHLRKEKGTLFVRYYIQTASGVITKNSKEVPAASNPEWGEAFSLECKGNGSLVSELQSQFLGFEVRWRSQSLWGNMRGGSKLLASVKIAWKDLLESSCLSLEKWFPLSVEGEVKGEWKPPSMHIALSATPPTSVPSVEKTILPAAGRDSGPHSMKSFSSSENVERRRRRLERDECSCRGQICNAHSFEGMFPSATSFRDAAWGV
ncbi:hypothetical protein SUGI_0991820 [Cryptomeria japonica]|uniref:glycine-rich domain-containing protein 1 n=1 Tax=Cryptomeria japonica TaxID=3369 RepID=UPI002414CC2E|nr:glycine-rich domain-containing protein 1 [Cryptomeria japonica]GLJ46990.1 hypothetical protein SUGI_0991820 [Cryptomeria japonica]